MTEHLLSPASSSFYCLSPLTEALYFQLPLSSMLCRVENGFDNVAPTRNRSRGGILFDIILVNIFLVAADTFLKWEVITKLILMKIWQMFVVGTTVCFTIGMSGVRLWVPMVSTLTWCRAKTTEPKLLVMPNI